MKISVIQHVDFEGPGAIALWAKDHRIELNILHAYANSNWDSLANSSAIVIMGGPMGVYDDHKFPWMKDELRRIEQAISTKIPVLGICLGAQIIARVLGADVFAGPYREIGWFPLEFHKYSCKDSAFAPITSSQTFSKTPAFHWHGDTFDLPTGATLLASTKAFCNQAFVYGHSVYGLQFHWEILREGLHKLVENCREDIQVESKYVQSVAQITEPKHDLSSCQPPLYAFLDSWLSTFST